MGPPAGALRAWMALKDSVRPFSLQNWSTILITLAGMPGSGGVGC